MPMSGCGGPSDSGPLPSCFLQPRPGAPKARVSLLPTAPPPQVPRALFLVLISRGQLGSPEMSAKTLRESQASPLTTRNLSNTELFISTALPDSKHHHRLFPKCAKIWSGAQPLIETETSFVFVFLFLPKTSCLRIRRLPPASPRCHFGSGPCRLAAASQGPLLAVGSAECCSHPAWKALH